MDKTAGPGNAPSVRFTPEREDYVRGYNALRRSLPPRHRLRDEAVRIGVVLGLSLVGLVFFLVIIQFTGRGADIRDPWTWITFLAIAAVLRYRLLQSAAQSYADRQMRLATEQRERHKHSYTVQPDGLREHGNRVDRLHPWTSFQRVARTNSHILLFTSPTDALMLPVDAFSSANEADRFAAAASEAVERSRSAGASVGAGTP